MADLASVVKKIVEEGLAGKDDTLIAHLAEDAVLNIPMRGEIRGRSAIITAMSSQPRPPTPPGTTIGEPEIDGETVKVIVTLPPGQMISKLTYTLKFEGEQIKRLDISL